MKSVQLSLPIDEDKNVDLAVDVDIPESELLCLQRYVALMERVRAADWLQRGMGGFKGFRWERGTIAITSAECADAELHQLLHLLRPVTLENESFGFHRALSILARRIDDRQVRAFLKLCGRVFRHGEMSLYVQITLDKQPMFHESMLNTWLNGTQYHSDEEKASAWQALEESLTAPNARALVVSQLHSKVVGLLNVDYISRAVIQANDA